MRKIRCLIFLMLIIILFSGCQKFVLRKYPKEAVPFGWKKGTLAIELYKIKYPEEILAREKFYSDLDSAVTKLYLYKNKVNVVFDESFFNDYKNIEKGDYISGEEPFYKVSSSLTEDEKTMIKKVTGKNIQLYKDTVQEYLNLQVLFWLKIAEKEVEFDENKLYTELDKEVIVAEVKQKRIDLIKKIARVKMEICIEIADYYNVKSANQEYKENYMSKDIVFNNNYRYDLQTGKYSNPVVIKNMKRDDIEKTIGENITFKNRAVIIVNEHYNGYKVSKGEIIVYNGGKKEVKGVDGYNVDIKIIDSNFEELVNVNTDNTIASIFGGK